MALNLFGVKPAQKAPAAVDGATRETTTQTFMADVVDASMQVPVLVDFWAPWCGPCKQLTPVLERLVKATKGAVRLVKMNIDEHPAIAQQMGVQSIPAVFAFSGGRPVDGFVGQLPESQIKAFIDRLLGPGGASDGIEDANAALAAGDVQTAAQLYAQLLSDDAQNVDALSGLTRCYLLTGDMARAEQTLALVPPAQHKAAAYVAALAAIDVARKSAGTANIDVAALAARVAADPDDHEARLSLALALNGRGDRAGATDALIAAIRRDRNWNDDAARRQLLDLIAAWGPGEPLAAQARQKLSTVLFS